MSTLLTPVTYRVVEFIDSDTQRDGICKFVAIAWNYSVAVLMSTEPYLSHTGARKALDKLAAERGCTLRWFDGEYVCDGSHDDAMTKHDGQPHQEEEEACSHAGGTWFDEPGEPGHPVT